MARRRGKGSLVSLAIRLDRPGAGEESLSRQLYAAMRAAILEGRLGAGDRMPASRVLAADLGVSVTMASAFGLSVPQGSVTTITSGEWIWCIETSEPVGTPIQRATRARFSATEARSSPEPMPTFRPA